MGQEEIPIVSVTPNLEFLYTSKIEMAEPLSLGNAPYGERRANEVIITVYEVD